MKKLLLLLMVASFGIAGTATAQKKAKKNHPHDKHQHAKKHDRRYDDRRYENNRRNVHYYNNNAPRKVRDAFNRDYPNAKNITWTKDRGVWTASFKNGGLFGGNRSVSYAANGRRVDNNSRVYDRTARTERNTWDGIFN